MIYEERPLLPDELEPILDPNNDGDPCRDESDNELAKTNKKTTPTDHDGSRPGYQSGPSKGDVVWMGTRRVAKFASAVAVGVVANKLLGVSATEAVGIAGLYMGAEKTTNESIHRKKGKPVDVDFTVLVLEFIKGLIKWLWDKRK